MNAGPLGNGFSYNYFKPLLLCLYMGCLIPFFKVPFEVSKAMYKDLTIYLSVSIGWCPDSSPPSLSTLETKEVSP